MLGLRPMMPSNDEAARICSSSCCACCRRRASATRGVIDLNDAFQQFHSGNTRHHEIDKDNLRVCAANDFGCGCRVVEGKNFEIGVPGKGCFDQRQQIPIIVDRSQCYLLGTHRNSLVQFGAFADEER